MLHQARRLDDQRRTARATVVDFGSGATFFPFTIARLGCDVVCVDNDPVCVRGVRRAIGHVDAGRGSARAALSSGADIPVEDQSADLVYSVSTLEHVQEPEQLVPELSRILVPGGTLVLTIDLAYRGTQQLGQKQYYRLRRALESRFQYVHAVATTHPADVLYLSTSPYAPGASQSNALRRRLRALVMDVVLDRPRPPKYPIELTVEGLVMRKAAADPAAARAGSPPSRSERS